MPTFVRTDRCATFLLQVLFGEAAIALRDEHLKAMGAELAFGDLRERALPAPRLEAACCQARRAGTLVALTVKSSTYA